MRRSKILGMPDEEFAELLSEGFFGHPIEARGLRMVYEIYHQLRGKADPRQVKDAKVGLIHNIGGGLAPLP